jgi:uncharacterized protein (TIGR00725 family)
MAASLPGSARTGPYVTARYVAVVGPGQPAVGADGARAGDEPGGASLLPAEVVAAAEEVGAELARQGAYLVCGGLGGVMEATCRGAARHGGQTIGLLPGRDRSAGNPHLSVILPTGLGELRNGLVVAVSDAVIAVGGSWGTLSEIALAVRTGKPTVVLGPLSWQIDFPGHGYAVADTPREAVEQALRAVSAC